MIKLEGVPLVRLPRRTLEGLNKDLLRAESSALVLSFVATALAFEVIQFVWHNNPPGWIIGTVLPLVGPLTEKPGLAFPYAITASRNLRRKRLSFCKHFPKEFWRTLKEENFFRIIRADILFHDTFYTSLVFLLTTFVLSILERFIPGTLAAGLIALVSFITAAFIASYLEYQIVDWRLRRMLRYFRKKKATIIRYGERRYLKLHSGREALFLDKMSRKLGLKSGRHAEYQDTMIRKSNCPEFNDWDSFAQIRTGTSGTNVQIICYQTVVVPASEISQGFTYVDKIKIRIDIPTASLKAVRQALGRYANLYLRAESYLDPLFSFERDYVNNPDDVSIAVDTLKESEYVLVELKFWPDQIAKAEELDHYTTYNLHVVSTTQPRAITTKMFHGLKSM